MENILNSIKSDDVTTSINQLADISDKIMCKIYSNEDVDFMLEDIGKISLQKLNYELREQLLYLLCEIVNNYKINNIDVISNIINQKSEIEVDLQEYIDEIVSASKLILPAGSLEF